MPSGSSKIESRERGVEVADIPRATNACIFCGRPADSKEDLFPRWILKRVKTGQPLVHQLGDGPRQIVDDPEVRIPCACQKCNNGWMSRMERTAQKFMGLLIDDFSVPLNRQQQQTLSEWAVKCAMCNDAIDVQRPRFFTDGECHTFKQSRTIPARTMVFAAQFAGRSFDSIGSDFALTEPGTDKVLVHGHVYNVMVGHLVLQVAGWRPEPEHEDKIVRMKFKDGIWDKLTIQIWPFEKPSLNWPPPMSLSTKRDLTHYGHFRERFRRESGHELVTVKKNEKIRS
jgi:hypothetical protein